MGDSAAVRQSADPSRQPRSPARRTVLAAVAITALLAAACTDDGRSRDQRSEDKTQRSIPSADHTPAANADWKVVEPAAEGIDTEQLDRARAYAFKPGANTQGVVVIHRGRLIAEWYAPGRDRNSPAASWSMAKSVTSALIGIAIADGDIAGVDEPMTTWFPAWKGTPKERITLRDVLTMSTGLDWVEEYEPGKGRSNIIDMVLSHPDELAYAAGIPAKEAPGERFNYSSGDSMLLSAVLQQSTGQPVTEYAAKKLFEPIGMSSAHWWTDAKGHALTYCCVDATSRDFARFGQLFLERGRWHGRQVVPRRWVEESFTDVDYPKGVDEGYGFQWWIPDPKKETPEIPGQAYLAIGHDGQWIIIVPKLDLVIVRNGTYTPSKGPRVADPNLFGRYPANGLVKGQGTVPPPGDWDPAKLVGPIVKAVETADH